MRYSEWIDILDSHIQGDQFIEFHLVDSKKKTVRVMIPKINGQFIVFNEQLTGTQTNAVLYSRFRDAILGLEPKNESIIGKPHPRIKDKTAVFGFTDERLFGQYSLIEFMYVSNDSPVVGACSLIFHKQDD